MSSRRQRCSNDTYLTPTRCTDINRKDFKEPRADFADPGEEIKKGDPYTNEEGKNEDEDTPLVLGWRTMTNWDWDAVSISDKST